MHYGLSERAQKFIEIKLANPLMPASKAAIAAGYAPSDARKRGSTLMRHPLVQEALRMNTRVEIERGIVLPPERVLIALSEIAQDISMPPASRVQALQLLAKHHGMLNDQPAVGTVVLGAQFSGAQLEEIARRALPQAAAQHRLEAALQPSVIDVD